MSYNNLHGYLIKDSQVKLIKKFIPTLIEGNSYDGDAKGYFKLSSFRKYTWTSPERISQNQYVRYDYHVELEFHGTYNLWGTDYTEKNWKYIRPYRKRNIHRNLKYMAEKLIRDNIKFLDLGISPHDIIIKKVTLKTKEA